VRACVRARVCVRVRACVRVCVILKQCLQAKALSSVLNGTDSVLAAP